ncbi:hypothetical protein F4680DRAFT_422256 [Xylaria scruposa]|nr:hypothetical protein F4680DRAFT_422256 [Xylaria scruposa]
MSAPSEDPGQGDSPRHAGESSHAGGRSNGSNGFNGSNDSNGSNHPPDFNSIEHDEEDPVTGAPQQGGQGIHGYYRAGSESADSDVKNTGPRSAVRHNTPASTDSTPAPAGTPGLSPAHIATAFAALAQRAATQGNGSMRANGESNRVSSTGTPATTGGSPSPPPPSPPRPSLPLPQLSPASAALNPRHPTRQRASAGQAEATATEAHRSGPSPSLSPSGVPGPTSHQGSQIDTEGQNGTGDSSNHSPREDEVATEPNQPPVTPQQNNSQQISRGIPSLDGAYDGGETATIPSASQGRVHFQHHVPVHGSSSSTQFALSRPLQESQPPGPAPVPVPVPVPVPEPSIAQASGSSSMNPIAPSFVPRPEQPNTPQSITLPTWQPDTEVSQCPICGVRFGMFLRRHHCRKCGRVVCDGCSPHRITIPHPYIVRPPGDPGPALQLSYPGVERGIADFSSIGGGERVRLCNPCVPDPNTAPPQPQQTSRPIIVDGRASRARPSNESFGGSSADARPYPQHPQLRSQGYTSRNRSATTSTGHAQEYFPFFPYSSTSSQYPQPNTAAYYSQSSVPHRRVSSAHIYPPHMTHFGRLHGSSSSGFVPSFSGLNRPLPRTPTPEPEIPEEDVCPVCHRELPSRSLSNCEALREAHINNCITSHSNYRGDQAVTAIGTGNHGTPPPRTTRRTRMFPYVATEKDCVGDVECTICLEEFKVGDQMARLECFCRFHRSCIDSWFVNRPGRCPVHQHDSFGY